VFSENTEPIPLTYILKIGTPKNNWGAHANVNQCFSQKLKYWIDPTNAELINRGSCTCNAITKEGEQVVQQLLNQDLENTQQFECLLNEQRLKLKDLLNFDGTDQFELFFAPSGTDLVFFPLVISQILNPGKPILNVVSCPEELGSGTVLASQGLYHADYNQFEESLPKGTVVVPDLPIEMLSLDARSKDGSIINHNAFIKEQIEAYPDHSIIMNLVYGSKSGIEDNLNIIDEIDRKDIIWTVDMCQFRHSRQIIHRLLDRDALVYLTGSKFYQAPPFCGAMLLSKPFFERLVAADWSPVEAFSRIFSAYDFPEVIRQNTQLPKRKNISLLLRWACAIEEITRFKATDADLVNEIIERWNTFTNTRLAASDYFELMPDQRFTNDTIISFRVKKDGRYLNHAELKQIHKAVATDGLNPEIGFRNVFIGQPVAYGDRSFLRLAIGANNIQTFIRDDERDFEMDRKVIEFIESKVAAFESH
ncbi:MAG: hypothetical protein AAFV80_09740, partial [Bacteroidota bacterium]